MAPSLPRPRTAAPSDAIGSSGVVVRRPRAGDGIGVALRESFDGTTRLPDDFRDYLRALDAIGRPH